MVRRLVKFSALVLLGMLSISVAHANYGAKICKKKGYKCVKVKKGDSWGKLFPSSRQRDVVMRLNRMN